MPQPINPNAAHKGRYAFMALLIANAFMALGPWMVRLADVGPTASGFWRLALAIPFLLLIAKRGEKGHFQPAWAMGGVILVGGLFFAGDLAAWHQSIQLTKMANASLFANNASLLFPIYGFIAAKTLPQRHQIMAMILAALGAFLLLGSSYELSPAHMKGDLFAILAGVFYTLYLIAMNRARETLHPIPLLALVTVAGAPPLLFLAWILGEPLVPHAWAPLIMLSIGSQVIGQGLLIYAMGHLSPIVVGLSLLSQLAISAAIGWMVYGEQLSVADGLGALFICAALVLIRMPVQERA